MIKRLRRPTEEVVYSMVANKRVHFVLCKTRSLCKMFKSTTTVCYVENSSRQVNPPVFECMGGFGSAGVGSVEQIC